MSKGTILVTGGAGYIGSHVTLALLEAGWQPVVIDNLSTGSRELLPRRVPLVVADIADGDTVATVLRDYGCVAAMHFAGSIVVPESMADPLKYYRNNTAASRTLLEACVRNGVRRFVFSSTAAVYGIPEEVPVSEDTPTLPINPYGRSKLMTEWMLRDLAASTDFSYAALRYFNVAGADPLARTGQATPDATHLIKVACEAAVGLRKGITVFGNDYDTEDGTCVRDFIHVSDLADAHVRALDHLMERKAQLTLNCGYGHGFSVREVLAAVEQVAGRALVLSEGPRRAGDPPELIADSRRLRELLRWTPRYDDLGVIVATALAWERKRLELRQLQRAESARQAEGVRVQTA